jgi:hypothetical protein
MTTKKNSRKSSAQPAVRVGPRWLLPTNHYNLMEWLAAGLILPESAMRKYYADCLRTTPGWLPLFRDCLAQAALDAATEERGIPVLLDIDLTAVSGLVQAVTASGELIACSFPDGTPADVTCILVPAPLPAHFMRQVSFATKDAREDYRLRREEFANVATFDVPLEVETFPTTSGFMDQSWLPVQSLPSLTDLPVNAALHEGAMRAALHHIGNRGELSLAAAKAAFADVDSFMLESTGFRDAMNQSLSHGVKQREAADLRIRLYWSVVDHLRGLHSNNIGVEQAVLDYLEQAAANDEKNGPKLKELAGDLRQLLGMGGSTVRELFERHPGAFAHGLLLFFLRKHTDELYDFDTPGVPLTESDVLAASILFALRDNWLSTPAALRNVPGLYPAIAQRMAKILQQVTGTNLKLGDMESFPTLRELFYVATGRWTTHHQAAALEFARAMKWTDAIETRVQLGKGCYRLEVGLSGGMQIVLPGEVKAVTTEVREESLLGHIAQCRWPVDASLEARVRDLLKGKQG